MAIIGGVALGLGAAAGGLGMTVAALALGLNLLAFVPAAALRTERFYDLVGSLTFTAIVFYVVNAGSGSERVFQVGCAILLWAARLGSFLVRRVRREGGDGRFDEMKVQPARFLLAWCMQALWASTTTLSLVALDAAGGIDALAESRQRPEEPRAARRV
jgi:steroid 5-alpha reductase family enzyme